ncbi:MAG: PAS domain S-box protein [Planctomycetes bacterium]|nr:PAS domain S-box protein [Planctomycetota bacterium]
MDHHSSTRLQALLATGLLDSPADPSFDRIVRLAAKLLKTPVALVSLLDERRLFLKSSLGLPRELELARELPLTEDALCKHVVVEEQPLAIPDTRLHPRFSTSGFLQELQWIAYLGVPLRDPAGVVLGAFCVIDHDVRNWTDDDVQLMLELAGFVNSLIAEQSPLAKALWRFRSLVDHSGDFIALADLNTQVTFVNPAGRRLVGLGLDAELSGKSIADFLTAETVQIAMKESIPAALSQGQWRGEGRLRHFGDGHAIETEINFFVLREAGATVPAGFATILRDITKRNEFRRQLTESEARFRNSFENAPIGMALASLSGQWTRVNLALTEMLQRPSYELIGKAAVDFWQSDDIVSDSEHRARCISGQCPRFENECVTQRNNDAELRALRVVSLVRDSHGRPQYFIEQFQDVTQQRRFEESLRIAKESAEAASQAKSGFLANISHELRTPLAAILGNADMLLDPRLPGTDRDTSLQSIRRNASHLLQLINDVLDLSKIEAGKLELECLPYPPWTIILEAVSALGVRATEAGLTLRTEPIGHLPDSVVVDPTRYRQIVLNLVGNAIKFTPRGKSVCVRMSWQPSVEKSLAELILDVVDEGIGIAPEVCARLFQPFEQGDSSTTREYGGTGLGLSITQHLIRAMNGSISLHSEVGCGSTFTVRIPVEIVTGGVDGAGWPLRESRRQSSAGQARGRILLAEDSPDNRRVLLYYLNRAGFQTDAVENGRLAVEQAHRARYDAILLDMQMPELDGYGAASALRREGYPGPIIALTANAMQSDREKCLRAGCTDYLSKPVTADDLTGCIGRNLHSAKSSSAVSATDGAPHASDVDEAFEKLKQRYIAHLAQRIEEAQLSLASADFARLRTLAHQTRGVAATYGFSELGDVATALESAIIAEQPVPDIARITEQWIDLARTVLATTSS